MYIFIINSVFNYLYFGALRTVTDNQPVKFMAPIFNIYLLLQAVFTTIENRIVVRFLPIFTECPDESLCYSYKTN